MQYDKFIGLVHNRARLASSGEAVRATRATLEVLGQRLFGGEPKDLAAQLPQEIGRFLLEADESESFGLNEFYERVSQKEGVDLPVAVHHARAVMTVVQEAVSAGEWDDLQEQLPDEYNDLFEAEDIEQTT